MINLFNRIYQWIMKFVLAYHEFKHKNYQRHKCTYCKKTYIFDVPRDIPVEQITFICTKCESSQIESFLGSEIEEAYQNNLKEINENEKTDTNEILGSGR